MLNINEKLLDELDADQYYLISKLARYGKKSCPRNEVLCKATKWGIKRIQRVKKELIALGILEVSTRWKKSEGKAVRDSNQYRITSKLISKYNKKAPNYAHVEQFTLEQFGTELVRFDLDQFELVRNGTDSNILRIVIIDNKELLIEKDIESKKALTQEIELLKIMNEKYKEEIEALNSESKPEVVPPPTDYSLRKPRRKKELPKGFESELDKSLKTYTFPKEIQADLLEKTLEYFSYLEQKKGSNWGIARTVNAQVKTIKDLTAKFTDEEIIKSLDECMDNGNVSFNPQWTLNRNKEKTQKERGPKKFSYELPDFVSKNQREAYFRARLATYRPQLDNRTYNTVYHKRAYGPQRDVEGVVYDLEKEKPELLKIKFVADSWQDIR